ncbi:hypothetical protein [Maribacter stanieri]|uniref:hypothetical protein n=1 Tax=Maribacter stanieri TaxID=440514 RepID=UPI0024944971|nr:hypothetical protein [Maribacter stanieri]|tara:strand:- start:2278 stop:2682 length:405 start_codon:yes stop_codon:yes gene_type:complete
MRKSIILLVLFFAQLCFRQEKEITKSFLIDRWKVDKTLKEGDTEITVYKRSRTLKIGNELRFFGTGEYRITYNSGRKIGRRYGNEIRSGGVNGYYRFNSQEQSVTLESYNTDPIVNWGLVWIDENSFGVKKNKR